MLHYFSPSLLAKIIGIIHDEAAVNFCMVQNLKDCLMYPNSFETVCATFYQMLETNSMCPYYPSLSLTDKHLLAIRHSHARYTLKSLTTSTPLSQISPVGMFDLR